MAKGGRMIVNKSRRGIRRFNGDGDESDDDEYIAEEDEIESESYDESLASSSESDEDPPEFGENLAEFSGSDHNFDEDEADFEFDDSEFEPEEEEEVRLKRSKKGRKKLGKTQKKSRKQGSDEEEDFDFSKQVPNWDEEEEFDLDDNPVEFKTKKKRSKRRKKSDEESDYELEAADDLDINPIECKKKKSRSKRNKSDEESDYEQEAEDYSDEDLDEDEDFSPDIDEEEEEFLSIRKRKLVPNKEKKNPIKKKKSRVSRRKKTSLTKNKKETKNRRKRIRSKKKKNSLKEPVTKRRRRTNFIKDEEEEELFDDYFFDDDDEFLIESRKKSNKSRKRKPGSDSETSEFEFLTSEESESEPEFKIQTQIRPKRRKKLNSKSDFSNSSDSDFIIQEPETALIPPRKRKRETLKGKEVEKDELEDSGKKVCGICLNEEQKRTTPGVLDCCAHFFCFACIIEWSKVESRCPVCKRRFETITKASSSDSDDLGFGAPNKVVKVPKRDQVYQPSEEDLRGMLDPYENVVCMECQQGGDDNLMLLCDICDSSAHTYCVGLGHSVPEGNWYCDCCRSSNTPFHPSSIPFTPSNIPFPPSNALFQPPNAPFPPSQPENVLVANSEVDLSVAGAANTAASSSGLEIDLNAPPVEEEGSQVGAPSPSAGGAATLSGRRAIRQRIRILLSNTRAMQIVVRQNGEGVGASNREHLPPAGGSRFGPLDPQRAKERVRPIVKSQLRNLCVNSPLEYDVFKSVARGATYSVLAACGIRIENRNVVCGSVQPPQHCGHEIRNHEGTSLLRDVCSDCFTLFVRDVVARVLNMSS